MIKIVNSVDEIPETHRAQLKNRKCPVTGKSDTTLRKVVTLLPGVTAYRVNGSKWREVWFNPNDLSRSAEANRAHEAKAGPRLRNSTRQHETLPKNTWANLIAARALYLEALEDHKRAIEAT